MTDQGFNINRLDDMLIVSGNPGRMGEEGKAPWIRVIPVLIGCIRAVKVIECPVNIGELLIYDGLDL